MKIAINTLPLYKTKVGMGKYIIELVNRIPKDDPENCYVIYVSEKNEKYFDLTAKNITIKKVPDILTSPFLKIIWEQLFLPFSLIKNSVDIYHATGFVLPLWKPKKTKFVVTIADMTFFTHPQYHKWFKNSYFRVFIPISLKNADKVLAISENTKEDIVAITQTNPKKIQTVHLGVDSYFIPEQKKEYGLILAKYKIKQPYTLFVGMLEPRKNIIGLIKAFSLIEDKKGHILVIVGEKGWMYDTIFSYVNKLGLENDVLFIGYVPDHDLAALYSRATCFVYPSFYEGFGIPVIEAMACGCPVITSNNSSLKEIVGDAAILIDPYSVEQIAEKMQLLLQNKEEQQKRKDAGLKQARKYKWELFAKKTKNTYERSY
jgi:glycosyltransferase involved in cell wall biosynthesis